MIHDSVSREQGLTLLALALAITGMAAAHEVPGDVTVQVFFRPERQRLQLLVRVPLRAIRDVDVGSPGTELEFAL